MDIHSLIQYLSHERHIGDYVYLSAAAFFIYDYILTLHLEIRLIWLTKWTYTTVLFLLTRYLAFTCLIIWIWTQVPVDVSLGTCKTLYPTYGWTATLFVPFAEAILSLRTWAVWNRNKMLGVGLGLMTIAHFVSQLYLANNIVRSYKFLPSPYPGFRGCFLVYTNPIFWANFVIAAIVEAIVLMLMVISAYRLYRQGVSGELARVIHRDGVLFYVYLFAINALNLVFVLAMPNDLIRIVSPIEVSLYSVLTGRIFFNIREVANRGLYPELHTTFSELFPVESTIKFRPLKSFANNLHTTTVTDDSHHQ